MNVCLIYKYILNYNEITMKKDAIKMKIFNLILFINDPKYLFAFKEKAPAV